MNKLPIDILTDLTFDGIPPSKVREVVDLIDKDFFATEKTSIFDWRKTLAILLKKTNYFDVRAESDNEILRQTATIIMTLYFVARGRRVFVPVEELCVALINTKVPDNITAQQLHAESDCFYIQLPEKAFYFPEVLGRKTKKWLQGVCIYQYTDIVDGQPQLVWAFLFVSSETSKTPALYDDCIEFIFTIEPVTLIIGSDTPINTAIEMATESLKADNKEDTIVILSFLFRLLMFLRLSPNLLRQIVDQEYIELTNKAKAAKNQAKAQKYQKKLNTKSPSNVVSLAPNVQYVNKLAFRKSGDQSPLNNESNRKKMRAHIVSGHMRHQPFGSRKNPQYKWIWIYPFWRGESTDDLSKSKKIIIK